MSDCTLILTVAATVSILSGLAIWFMWSCQRAEIAFQHEELARMQRELSDERPMKKLKGSRKVADLSNKAMR